MDVRDEIETLQTINHAQAVRIATLEAENDLLREALKRIAGTTMSMVLDAPHGMMRCRQIAHDTLNPQETDDE